MISAASAPKVQAATTASTTRLRSLDVFRGLVIVVMTFVNYLAGVSQIPAWAQHMPAQADGYTLVDIVFPAFLFAAGMSIPLALKKRIQPGIIPWKALGRIFTRGAALIFLGVLMVNTGDYDSAHAVLPKKWWYLLAYLSVIAIWCEPPREMERRRRVWLGARIAGISAMVLLLCLFRGKGDEGHTVWLQHSWWGILGLIGWAYLVCSLLYLATKGNATSLMGWLGFLLCLYIGGRHGLLDWLGPINGWVDVGSMWGSTAASMLIGVIVTLKLTEAGAASRAQLFRWLLIFGAMLYAAGLLLRPLRGINKNAATTSYTLVAGAICCLCFAIAWLVCEQPWSRNYGGWLTTAGQNAVLAYILPGILGDLCAIVGLPWLLHPWSSGWAGAANSALLTALVIAITCGTARLGIRLRL
jgi:predicted acyltransferase